MFFALLGIARAQTVAIEVEFKLTDIDYKPLPREMVRLVLGTSPGWQNPDAGDRFVTDENGEARFTANGIVDKRWRADPVGFTGLSIPSRKEHMTIAAELERRLQLQKGAEPRVFRWLLTMDLDCTPGECATSDFTALYTPDAQGRFTQQPPRVDGAWKIPELNGAVLSGLGYQTWDHMLTADPADPIHKRHLKLAFQRLPAAQWR